MASIETFFVIESSDFVYSRMTSNNFSANGSIIYSTWNIRDISVSNSADYALKWFIRITPTIRSVISPSNSLTNYSEAF